MASPELKLFVDAARSTPVAKVDIKAMRAGLDALEQHYPLPADVQREAVSANGVAAEWLTASEADTERALLYLHGGGYVMGSIRSHRHLAASIAKEARLRALVLDYRLAPEHPFPAAVDDAVAAYRWLLEHGFRQDRVALVGDSAGAGLTLGALVALKDAGLPMPAGAVCMSPWVDLALTAESISSRAALDPFVFMEHMVPFSACYLNGADPRSPLASPLYADLSGLPPLLIQVGTSEKLFDDAVRIAERARAAGVAVTLEPWEEMVHVFQAFLQLPEAHEAIARIGRFLRARTQGVQVGRPGPPGADRPSSDTSEGEREQHEA